MLLFSCSFGTSSASPCTSNLVELNTSLSSYSAKFIKPHTVGLCNGNLTDCAYSNNIWMVQQRGKWCNNFLELGNGTQLQNKGWELDAFAASGVGCEGIPGWFLPLLVVPSGCLSAHVLVCPPTIGICCFSSFFSSRARFSGLWWGGVGMLTFLALAHMFDATP